jgi:hypothetical protein
MPLNDRFNNFARGREAPGRLLTTSAATKGVNFPEIARSLLVGTAGTANLIDGDGVTHTAVPLQQGYNPIENIAQVAAGGTADDIWPLI